MGREKPNLLPKTRRLLFTLGENLKLARRRRRLTTEQVAERAGISRATLWSIEKGAPSCSIGAYLQVLFVLGLEKDIQMLGRDDTLGRRLQDASILVKKRAPKRPKKKELNYEQD